MAKRVKVYWTILAVFLALWLNGFFLGKELEKYGFNFSVLFRFGEVFVNRLLVPSKFLVFENTEGYDGQFYYVLAQKPFAKEPSVMGVSLDDPPYRQQRFLFPVLAGLLSLGQPTLLPYVFVGINLVCLMAIAYLGTRLAERSGKHPIFGLIFALYPGFLFSLSRNVVEILEITLLLGAFLALEKKRILWAGILLSLAILARETALIAVFGLAAYMFLRRLLQKKRIDPKTLILPLATYLTVRIWIYLTWHNFGTEFGGHTGIPFEGFLGFLVSLIPPGSYMERAYLVSVVYFLIFCTAVLFEICLKTIRLLKNYYALGKTRHLIDVFRHIIGKYEGLGYVFIWLLSLVLASLYSDFIWREDPGYLRALSEFFIVGFLILLKTKGKAIYFLFLGNFAVWFYLARHIILMR
jgi:hypothetical protein